MSKAKLTRSKKFGTKKRPNYLQTNRIYKRNAQNYKAPSKLNKEQKNDQSERIFHM